MTRQPVVYIETRGPGGIGRILRYAPSVDRLAGFVGNIPVFEGTIVLSPGEQIVYGPKGVMEEV